MGRSWSREWGQGGGSSGLPSGPAPRHHPAALTPPAAIYSPIFPPKKLLCFIWDAGRFAGQQSPCCEHRLDLPLVGAPWALHQLLGHTWRGTAPAARTRGAPRAAVPAAPWLSPEHQGGREKPPEKPPVRREAAGPRRLGLWDEKSLRWLCWLFVDSSWLSWGLKATLKLSKQTLISQFSQPACNLSLALLYRGGSSAQLWRSLCSEHPEQQQPGHGQGERARAVPVSQHHSSIPDKASCVLQGMAQTSTGAG